MFPGTGKLFFVATKIQLAIFVFVSTKTQLAIYVSLDLQIIKIYLIRGISARQPKRKRRRAPKAWRRLFLCTKRFLYEIYCINCIKKDARALMYPVFQNSRTPFIYWLSRNLVCSFFVAGFCSFFVADKKRRNPFV